MELPWLACVPKFEMADCDSLSTTVRLADESPKARSRSTTVLHYSSTWIPRDLFSDFILRWITVGAEVAGVDWAQVWRTSLNPLLLGTSDLFAPHL